MGHLLVGGDAQSSPPSFILTVPVAATTVDADHAMETDNLNAIRSRQSVTIVALTVIIVGIVIILLADVQTLADYKTWQAILRNAGTFLIGTATLALLWEWFAKKTFFREIMEAVRLSSDIKTAGITAATLDFQEQVDWRDLFKGAREVDIFFSYARTWRNRNVALVGALMDRSDVEIRVLLPDPDQPELVAALAKRFEQQDEQVRNAIIDAKEYFVSKFEEGNGKNNELSVWYVDMQPQYAFYRFDRRAVVTFFNHLGRTGNVPTFHLRAGGTFFDFAREEFNQLTSAQNSATRHIFPVPPSPKQESHEDD